MHRDKLDHWETATLLSKEFIIALHHYTIKATVNLVTIMPVTSKNVLFSGHNHLLTTGADDLTLWLW